MGTLTDFIIVGALAVVFTVGGVLSVRRRLLDWLLNLPFFAAFEMVIRPVYWLFLGIVAVVDILLVLAVGINVLLFLKH